MQQKSKFCKTCNRKTLHAKEHFIGSGMGCLLVILTGGLFLIVWLLGEFVNMFGRYRCQVCGRKN
jgi:hypothetical protein